MVISRSCDISASVFSTSSNATLSTLNLAEGLQAKQRQAMHQIVQGLTVIDEPAPPIHPSNPALLVAHISSCGLAGDSC